MGTGQVELRVTCPRGGSETGHISDFFLGSSSFSTFVGLESKKAMIDEEKGGGAWGVGGVKGGFFFFLFRGGEQIFCLVGKKGWSWRVLFFYEKINFYLFCPG